MKNFKVVIFAIIFILCMLICPETKAFPASAPVIYEGIDVSEWQGNIEWESVENSRIKIVYIRASEGNSYKDPYAINNYNEAKECGLKVGFYHYLTASNREEAIEQACFFSSIIQGLEVDCRLAMDFEYFQDLSVDEINVIAETFLEEVEKNTGKDVVIYSDAYNAANVFSKELANKYPIWVADYDVSEPMNGNWKAWDGFQYSDQGQIYGIKGYVDRDLFTSGILLSDTSKIPEVINSSEKSETKVITVYRGQTLSLIAEEYNTSYQYLARINNISNPNLIYVGQKIIVPVHENIDIHDTNHNLYIVKRNDTLWQIALKYGVSIESIVKLNNIANPNLIFIGQILRIPAL